MLDRARRRAHRVAQASRCPIHDSDGRKKNNYCALRQTHTRPLWPREGARQEKRRETAVFVFHDTRCGHRCTQPCISLTQQSPLQVVARRVQVSRRVLVGRNGILYCAIRDVRQSRELHPCFADRTQPNSAPLPTVANEYIGNHASLSQYQYDHSRPVFPPIVDSQSPSTSMSRWDPSTARSESSYSPLETFVPPNLYNIIMSLLTSRQSPCPTSPEASTSPNLHRAIRSPPEIQPTMPPTAKRRLPTRALLAPITTCSIPVSPLLLILFLPFFIFVSFITQPNPFPTSMDCISTTPENRSETSIRSATNTDPQRPAVTAYSLQISPATIEHLPRLFQRLYHPLNVHAIHFDVKIPDERVHAAMKELRIRIPTYQSNTYVVPRQLVTYDGVSIILSTLSVMSFLLNDVSEPWDFFINLSGSDYPIVEPEVPRRLLGKARPYSPLFFSLANRTRWESAFRARAASFHIDDALTHQKTAGELRHVRARNPLIDRLHFVPAYGEAWMIVPRDFCRYVTTSDAARKMLLTVGNMRGGDEHFFVTLAYNQPTYNESIVFNSMRMVVWRFEGKHAGQHPFYLDETDEDGKGFRFLDLLRGSIAFHARKFRVPDSELMDKIDIFAHDKSRVEATEKAFDGMIARLKSRLALRNRSIDLSPTRTR